MTEFLQDFVNQISGSAVSVLGAIGILVIGWIVALIVGGIVRRVFRRTGLDDRLMKWIGRDTADDGVDTSRLIGKAAFYLVMLFVLLAFFQRLGLTIVTEPINALLTQIFAAAPRLGGAALILAAAWVIATILRFVITKTMKASNLDERLRSGAGLEDTDSSISQSIGDAVFWFVFLLFLPAVLSTLGMEGLVAPVQGLFDDLLGYIPNILGAGVILLVGWFVARIVRKVLTNVLAAAGMDRFADRNGLGEQSLSGLVGTVAHALIMIQVVIAALDALAIESISGPATAMLNTVWDSIPAFVGAVVVLGVSFYIGRWISELVNNVLAGVGFNRVLVWMGLGQEPGEGQRTPSEIVGYLVLVGVMLFAIVEAAGLLGFEILADLIAQVLGQAGQAIVAVAIFGAGMWLANLTRSVIAGTGMKNAALLGQVARIAIIVLVVAMALGQLGVAEQIVNLAFGLTLGAIAVAAALAFGLGSREIAAQKLDGWLKSMEDSDKE